MHIKPQNLHLLRNAVEDELNFEKRKCHLQSLTHDDITSFQDQVNRW